MATTASIDSGTLGQLVQQLTDISAILTILIATNTSISKENATLRSQLNWLKGRLGTGVRDKSGDHKTTRKNCTAVGRTSSHK